MIHQALSKSEIAFRYYHIVKRDRNYSKEDARKRFQQDRKIDVKVVRKVIDGIFQEQSAILKALGKV